MASAEETLLIPKDLNEAKELVNKLGIEKKTFCFTSGLPQDGTKADLKKRLREYYKGKLPLVSGAPVPTPRKKSAVKKPEFERKRNVCFRSNWRRRTKVGVVSFVFCGSIT